MATELIDTLAKRYDFEKWAQPEPRDSNLTVWRFDVSKVPLGAWQPYRSHTLPQSAPPRGLRGLGAKSEVVITDATLIMPENTDRVLRLAVFECASRSEARAQLLRVLGEFESTAFERTDTAGEVAFTMPGGSAVLFTRGNLVVVLRNGGAKVSSLAALGKDFEKMWGQPPQAPKGRQPLQAKPEKARISRPFPLGLKATEGTTVFLARGGEVEIVKGQPVFRPARSGDIEVTASSFSERGPVAVSTRTFHVE